MAAVVQQAIVARGGFGGNLQSAAPATSTTAGNALIVVTGTSQNEPVTSITDSAGNTYSKLIEPSTTWWRPGVWIAANASAVSSSGGWWQLNIANSRDRGLVVYEVSGLGASPTLSTSGGLSQSSAATTWSAVTTSGSAVAGDFVLSSPCVSAGVTASVSPSDLIASEAGGVTNPGLAFAVDEAAAAGSVSYTWSFDASRDGGAFVIALTPDVGGGGGTAVPVFFHHHARNWRKR